MSHRIRIKLKSFDHTLVDKSAEKIVKTINYVKEDKVVLVGPIPLPTQKKIFTVNRATFVNKSERTIPTFNLQKIVGYLWNNI